jgi:hypothetical protein
MLADDLLASRRPDGSDRRGDLTAVTGAQDAAGDPAGYAFDGTQHVVYRGIDGHIYELWWPAR